MRRSRRTSAWTGFLFLCVLVDLPLVTLRVVTLLDGDLCEARSILCALDPDIDLTVLFRCALTGFLTTVLVERWRMTLLLLTTLRVFTVGNLNDTRYDG